VGGDRPASGAPGPAGDDEALLEEDSTFYGDLFAHVVSWRGEFYLEDGLHRALRAALQQRQTMHARVLDLK
jgi:Arc/MetJ family transcription regulator